jgi:hypothetical protein
MSIDETFADYAQAFEEAYEDGDWTRLERFFSADAVYDPGTGEEVRGRDNILSYLQTSVDGLDKKFDSRILESSPATSAGNQTTIQWEICYLKAGLPELRIAGSETATFEGDVICGLVDEFSDGAAEAFQAWIGQHGRSLG